jgi:hypothetical protein
MVHRAGQSQWYNMLVENFQTLHSHLELHSPGMWWRS